MFELVKSSDVKVASVLTICLHFLKLEIQRSKEETYIIVGNPKKELCGYKPDFCPVLCRHNVPERC